MNRQGQYRTLSRLARGTVFHLSAIPTDTKSWRVLRHMGDGTTLVERLHEDRTVKRQTPNSTMVVFIPKADEPEQEEDTMDTLTLQQEREASIERMESRGEPTEAQSMFRDWGSGVPKEELGDGGYLTRKTPTEGGD
jgi:hypothetical protein